MFTYKKPATLLLHFALLTILVGACVTHFFGEQGEIHLRGDKAQSLNHQSAFTNSPSQITLFLWDFQVVTDPNTQIPVDYITALRILDRRADKTEQGLVVDEGTIRMNKPLKYHNWRFCQSNFDSDGLGVTLRYNHDPWGIGITYTGYVLLLLAMIGFFFQKNSRFRALFKSLTAKWPVSAKICVPSAFVVLVITLAFIMTKAVTPKPPLQPVLQTPLLGIHVSVIMLAYTLFAIIAICGLIGLCTNKLSTLNSKLSTVSSILLYPALFCLMAGIFIGAVWANMSWGRYWGWDPKETWALITMLVYAALLHFPWLKKYTVHHTPYTKIYHALCVIDFAFVLFTYFGVSYLLGGLHSYA